MKTILKTLTVSCLLAHGITSHAESFSATANDCIEAPKHCLLQVTPPLAAKKEKLFAAKIICDGRLEFLYQYTLKDQFAERKFLGTKLCKGVVSYSDMNLPFTTSHGIGNARDGLLAIDSLTPRVDDIDNLLTQMKELAAKASRGSLYTPTELANLNKQFQAMLSEINRVANVTSFNGIRAFDGSNETIDVPTNKGKTVYHIPLTNLTTGSLGLNIETLSLRTVHDAQDALSELYVQSPKISQAKAGLMQYVPELEAAAKREAVITTIDLNGAVFVVKTVKAS